MNDSLVYLDELKQRGIQFGIGPISRLLHRLGNPQHEFRAVLIGGTNGKGSTAALLASVLETTGMAVGLYTSPHLCDFRERIRINGCMIEEHELSDLIETVRRNSREDVTYFEFTTALAFLHFAKRPVDIAVVEVGMGGRLDATNLVSPEVSLITNVSLEHQKFLGRDLKSIACEKGGIIGENGVCITAATVRTVIGTLEDICSRRRATLYRIGKDVRVRRSARGTFSYYGRNKCYRDLTISLAGRYQVTNAALALAAVDYLAGRGMDISEPSVIEGLRKARWEGRLEYIAQRPRIIVDGAHNPAGIAALCRALVSDFTYTGLIVVCGILHDKNYTGMLKRLIALADVLILTRPREERATPPAELLAVIPPSYHDHVEIVEDSGRALDRARSLAGHDDLVCVTGSLYLVGEIKKAVSSWR